MRRETKKLETLKTIAFDIKDSVFNNDTEALMYVTNDIYSDSFIIAIPVISLSTFIRKEHTESDYKWLMQANVGIDDPGQKEKLVKVIKESISELE